MIANSLITERDGIAASEQEEGTNVPSHRSLAAELSREPAARVGFLDFPFPSQSIDFISSLRSSTRALQQAKFYSKMAEEQRDADAAPPRTPASDDIVATTELDAGAESTDAEEEENGIVLDPKNSGRQYYNDRFANQHREIWRPGKSKLYSRSSIVLSEN